MTTLLGKKLGMTQIFAPDGASVVVSLIYVPPTFVTQIKTEESDGYSAVQAGCDLADSLREAQKKIGKTGLGHLKKSDHWAKKLFEYRVPSEKTNELKVGQEINLDGIKSGEAIEIRGVSKGCGFAGVVKRHHFRGGPASHGHKDNLRGPGSIGAQQPQHVWPGTRMAGHMGAARVFVKNVEVIKTESDKRLVVVKGPVPGALNGWLTIKVTGAKVSKPVLERKEIVITKSEARADKKEKPKKDGKKMSDKQPVTNKK